VQLRGARLCLDCEELHAEDTCPVCASDAFVFLTRWIPVAERRTAPRPRPSLRPSTSSSNSRTSQLVKGSALGVVLVAAGRWLWRATRPEPPS